MLGFDMKLQSSMIAEHFMTVVTLVPHMREVMEVDMMVSTPPTYPLLSTFIAPKHVLSPIIFDHCDQGQPHFLQSKHVFWTDRESLPWLVRY